MSVKFTDSREILPTHATKTFSTRNVGGILGGVLHQTAGTDDVVATARYHVGPNHVSETGCPGILYTFYVSQAGEVHWCNDLEAQTWSQGGSGTPIAGSSANGDFLAIVLGGAFDGPSWEGDDPGPPFAQIYATLALWGHLTGVIHAEWMPEELYGAIPCPVESLYGHHKFGKANCPGSVMIAVVDSVRHYLKQDQSGLADTTAWQEALIEVGYDLGSWGADGDWGSASRAALTSFQKEYGNLSVDGIRGPMSEAALLNAVDTNWQRPLS